MKTICKVGDIIYCVNPHRLLISKTCIVKIEQGIGSLVALEKKVYEIVKDTIRITLHKFPIEKDELLYFRTKDEAEEFIKAQIGI